MDWEGKTEMVSPRRGLKICSQSRTKGRSWRRESGELPLSRFSSLRIDPVSQDGYPNVVSKLHGLIIS